MRLAHEADRTMMTEITIMTVLGGGALAILLIVFLMVLRCSGDDSRCRLFRLTVARSMVPLFASVVIVVGLLAHPHLTGREARFVQMDGLGNGGFTDIETKLTNRLREEFKLAVEQAAQMDKTCPIGDDPGQ